MDIKHVFSQLINDLQAGKRPLLDLNANEQSFLLEQWKKEIDSPMHSPEDLHPILAIIEHGKKDYPQFESLIEESLEKVNHSETLIFILAVARKQIIEARFKKSKRLSMSFLNKLKGLLRNKDPEVLEWTLRTIEQCGPQGILLKEDILNSIPSFLKRLNSHHKNSYGIIRLMLKQWGLDEKGRPLAQRG